MAYGKVKVNTLTYDTGGGDVDITISALPTTAAVALKADSASPTFTGTPAAPTAAVSTATTQIATTAFVVAEIADEVGKTVQAYDADLDALSSCQTGAATALALLTSTEVEVLDGVTAGTAEASKAVVLDASKDITGLNDIAAVDLTLSGDLTVNGTTTTVDQTNLDVSDNIIGLNRGASTNANDSGIIIERGTTGDNAIIAWDESEDKFTVGTTAATPSDTGDLTITAGTLVAGTLEDSEGNVRNIPASTSTTNVVADDAGKHINITAGIEIDDDTDFAIGDAVTIFNNQADGEDETITATNITLYLASDATESGNRTLAGRGVATILCVATDVYVITGAGLS